MTTGSNLIDGDNFLDDDKSRLTLMIVVALVLTLYTYKQKKLLILSDRNKTNIKMISTTERYRYVFFLIFILQPDAERSISIEVGNRFEYNNRLAYPIFTLKSNGQINCLLEYEK